MTAGQFELRMVDIERAGEGRNRGLDLMVYSFVTGTERDVMTLSGGESFMAALSLALGMADRIKESSSSVKPLTYCSLTRVSGLLMTDRSRR